MPQKERLRVWRNELKKTSGGLTRDQLTKNKRGKIVSRKKSGQAVGDANNLGSWLRGKGDKFAGKPKGLDEKEEEKLAEVPAKKTKAAPKKVKQAPKKVKAAPKKKQAAPKKKAAVVDLTDSPVKAEKPKPKKKKLEPIGREEELEDLGGQHSWEGGARQGRGGPPAQGDAPHGLYKQGDRRCVERGTPVARGQSSTHA